MKIDKSMQEVWDWKDKVYESVKNLSVKDAADKIKKDAEAISIKYNLGLPKISHTHS
jgi:hypothetical protein